MTALDQKLADFLALLEQLRQQREAQAQAERKAREDKKLARLKPWWLEASQ